MIIIGLTGSIGMGKSTMSHALRALGLAVLDADAVVHDLYQGPAAERIAHAFPGTVEGGRVDRARLSKALRDNPDGFQKLEAMIHPLVREEQRKFLVKQNELGAQIAVLEIPLLFETGADQRVDVTIVVSAPKDVQRARVLERAGMTEDKFDQLLAKQMPDEEKRERTDFVVDTGQPVADSIAQITDIVRSLKGRAGCAFETQWQRQAI